MKRVLWKIAKITALGLGGVVCAAAGYFYVVMPSKTAPSTIRAPRTRERIERGRYIYKLADCDGCHSEHDFTRFGAPVPANGHGKGFVFPKELGLPGSIAGANITPDTETGIGAWTDGEKIRAIREGISRDGRTLFPMMGYARFRHMSDEDVESLVAYLDTLPPQRNAVPRTTVPFPISMLVRTVPKPAGRVVAPNRTDRVKYGEYLVTLGGCAECHTKEGGGEPFAGGNKFTLSPEASVVSANLTPDSDTGIGSWTEDFFVSRFKSYQSYNEHTSPKATPGQFTVMPWLNLSQLDPEDLRAIYAYLRTVPAVANKVVKHPPVLSAGTAAGNGN